MPSAYTETLRRAVRRKRKELDKASKHNASLDLFVQALGAALR